MKRSDCEFCSPTPNGVKPLFESENFYVIPSLGQIVPGYLLVNTKEHFLSLSQMPYSEYSKGYFQELNKIIRTLRTVLSKYYAPPIFFEHGAIRERQGVCCVDHAHLQCVPLGTDILEDITEYLPVRRINSLCDIVEQQRKQVPYIYYESPTEEAYVASLQMPYPPSQFIRQLIAISVGKPDLWDWRTHPTKDLWQQVYQELASKL